MTCHAGVGAGWVGAELEPELSAHTHTHSHSHTHTLRQTAAARAPPSPRPHCGDTCPPAGAASASAHPHPSLADRVTLTHKKSPPEKEEKQAHSCGGIARGAGEETVCTPGPGKEGPGCRPQLPVRTGGHLSEGEGPCANTGTGIREG